MNDIVPDSVLWWDLHHEMNVGPTCLSLIGEKNTVLIVLFTFYYTFLLSIKLGVNPSCFLNRFQISMNLRTVGCIWIKDLVREKEIEIEK